MKQKIAIIQQILKLKKLKINIIDTDKTGEINELYHHFVCKHEKYKIFKNKTIGVEIYILPKKIEEYEHEVSGKNSVSYFSRRCKKMGYETRYFLQKDYLDDIFEINSSAKERQGRKMSKMYLSKVEAEEIKDCVKYYGLFKNQKLVGYIRLILTPDVYVIAKILGHKEYLQDNIMHLLLHDLMIDLIQQGSKIETNQYIMYDTFFGASEGLKLYKKRHCFKPYRIKWIYIDKRCEVNESI